MPPAVKAWTLLPTPSLNSISTDPRIALKFVGLQSRTLFILVEICRYRGVRADAGALTQAHLSRSANDRL